MENYDRCYRSAPMILYTGICPQCGTKVEGKLECPDLIPPSTLTLGCQQKQHLPVVLVVCQYDGAC